MNNAITIDELVTYRYVENLQYNPSGTVLAYQLAYADTKKNTYKRDIWVVKNGKPMQLTATMNASIVLWLDDETLVLSRATEDTAALTTDLYKINVNGGEAVKFVTLPIAMGALKKVNDNLFVASGTIDMHQPDIYLASEEDRKKYVEEQKVEHENYQVVDEVPYWFNGLNFTNGNRNALFEITLSPLSVKRVTEPAFDMRECIVRDDVVYFAGDKRERAEKLTNKVFTYNTTTKTLDTLYGKEDLSFGRLFFLDGKLYAQASDMKEYGVNETGQIGTVEKDTFTPIFKPEVSLYTSAVGDTTLGGGKGAVASETNYLTIATDDYRTVLFDYDTNLEKKVVRVEGMSIHCIDAANDKIAFCGQDWNHLTEVYMMDRDGSNLTKVSSHNDEALKDKYIAEPQVVKYTSEGEDLTGWVLLPINYDPSKKYPAVFDVHGGPRCVYNDMFFHEMQVWASQGYFVFFTNIRGSDGRGDAFADIRGKYGEVDFKNLMDFMDVVLETYPQIDTTRVCETGGSYGGFMTNWIIGHTDRFVCAASQRSISNWVSFSFMSDIGPWFGPDQCGADGPFDEATLWEHSPLKYAQNCTTPTLFIHSDQDRRCPLPEGMQMMQALAVQNIETRLCIFHGETHELSRSGKPEHRIRRLTEITNWFNEHTK